LQAIFAALHHFRCAPLGRAGWSFDAFIAMSAQQKTVAPGNNVELLWHVFKRMITPFFDEMMIIC